MKRVKIYTSVKGGKLADLQFSQALLAHEGKEIQIIVERKRKRRSLNQNSFMHGPFLESMQEMFTDFGNDYEPEFVKDIFKKQFGVKREVTLPDGTKEMVEVSTAKYSTTECETAMERARRFYASFWALPYPNEAQHGN